MPLQGRRPSRTRTPRRTRTETGQNREELLMRSPEEEVSAAAEATGAEPPRPTYPGGKAALRLLQLLESAGHTRATASVVNAAAPAGDLESFLTVASGYSAAPTAATTAAAAVETEGPTETDTDIAAEYLSTGQQMATAPSGAAAQWRSLGPLTIPNGQTYGASRVNVSGRVAAIAVDPARTAARPGRRELTMPPLPPLEQSHSTRPIPIRSTAAPAKRTGGRTSAPGFCARPTVERPGHNCAPRRSLGRASTTSWWITGTASTSWPLP